MFGWPSVKHDAARRALIAGVALCLLASTLALGACGAATPSRAASRRSAPGAGTAPRLCPGRVGDATQVGAVALTLTPGHAVGSLHVGDLAQIRLPATAPWTLTSQPSGLTTVGVAGGQDTALNICYWTFRAQSAGSVKLWFSGAPPCDNPPGGCNGAMVGEWFTISVL